LYLQVIKLQATERAAIKLRTAEYKANATQITLAKEAETYRDVMQMLNLTPEVRDRLPPLASRLASSVRCALSSSPRVSENPSGPLEPPRSVRV